MLNASFWGKSLTLSQYFGFILLQDGELLKNTLLYVLL